MKRRGRLKEILLQNSWWGKGIFTIVGAASVVVGSWLLRFRPVLGGVLIVSGILLELLVAYIYRMEMLETRDEIEEMSSEVRSTQDEIEQISRAIRRNRSEIEDISEDALMEIDRRIDEAKRAAQEADKKADELKRTLERASSGKFR